MEKVLDCGEPRTALANITNQIQQQVSVTYHELDKSDTDKKKKNSEMKKDMSDYTAFKKQLLEGGQNRVPSIFTVLDIPERKINFSDKKEAYKEYTYPLLGVGTNDLIELSCRLIQKQKSPKFYSSKDLRHFVELISKGYNVVSYHSFTHGVSLLHLLYNCFEMDEKLKNMFTSEEKSFCLLAAVAHDINHPGTTSGYENKRKTQWSRIANQSGVLEKMHIRYLFQLISKEKALQIDNHTDSPLLMKQLITRLILGTDMKKHFKHLDHFKELFKDNHFDQKNYDHRYTLMESLFHACDIGNSCLPYKDYINWAALVSYQFNCQAEKEAAQNLTVSPTMPYNGLKKFYTGQRGFINGFIYPLWKQLSLVLPGISPLVKNLCINVVKLNMKAEEEPQEQKSKHFIQLQ